MIRCWLGGHRDLILERRGPAHQIQWRCIACHRIVGVTELRPKASLLRRLKVNANRAALRLIKKVS